MGVVNKVGVVIEPANLAHLSLLLLLSPSSKRTGSGNHLAGGKAIKRRRPNESKCTACSVSAK
jgi:hypothetical protein